MAMNFLYSTFVAPDPSESQEVKESLLTLKGRLETATLPSDRLSALESVKDLAVEYKKLTGEVCLDQLAQVLETDREDPNLLRACLETFTLLFTIENHEDPTDLGIIFSTRFTKDLTASTALLGCLGSSDFYVRYNSINTIQSLHNQCPSQIEAALLASPVALSLLVELLDDDREVIRNDGLLLLTAVTETNLELQKIVAFQNVFDKLLGIIQGEAGLDGGIVVEDSFHLIFNLNQNNPSNQNYFRETSCIQRLPEILTIATEQSEPEDWENPQKSANLLKMLQLIRLLTQPHGTHTKSNQVTMERCGLVSLLIDLVSIEVVPPQLRSYCFFVLGNVVYDCRANQELVGAAVLNHVRPYPVPFLTFVTATALYDSPDVAVQLGATYLFQSYLSSNVDAQLAIASTLRIPPGSYQSSGDFDQDNMENASIGSLIISTLSQDSDGYASWLASVYLMHLLFDTADCKKLLLNVQLPSRDGPVGLLTFLSRKVMSLCGENASALPPHQHRLSCYLLSLIIVWLHKAPFAVGELLKEGIIFQFLIELSLPGSATDPLLRGLSSVLLAIIYSFNDESLSPFTSNIIHTTILKRVGSEQLTNNLSHFQDVQQFRDSRPWSQLPSSEDWTAHLQSYSHLDYRFVKFYKAHSDDVLRTLIEGTQAQPSTQAISRVRTQEEVVPPVPSNQTDHSEYLDKIISLESRVKELEEREVLHLDEINKLKIALDKADAYIVYLKDTRAPVPAPTSGQLTPRSHTSDPEPLSAALATFTDSINDASEPPAPQVESHGEFPAPEGHISTEPIPSPSSTLVQKASLPSDPLGSESKVPADTQSHAVVMPTESVDNKVVPPAEVSGQMTEVSAKALGQTIEVPSNIQNATTAESTDTLGQTIEVAPGFPHPPAAVVADPLGQVTELPLPTPPQPVAPGLSTQATELVSDKSAASVDHDHQLQSPPGVPQGSSNLPIPGSLPPHPYTMSGPPPVDRPPRPPTSHRSHPPRAHRVLHPEFTTMTGGTTDPAMPPPARPHYTPPPSQLASSQPIVSGTTTPSTPGTPYHHPPPHHSAVSTPGTPSYHPPPHHSAVATPVTSIPSTPSYHHPPPHHSAVATPVTSISSTPSYHHPPPHHSVVATPLASTPGTPYHPPPHHSAIATPLTSAPTSKPPTPAAIPSPTTAGDYPYGDDSTIFNI